MAKTEKSPIDRRKICITTKSNPFTSGEPRYVTNKQLVDKPPKHEKNPPRPAGAIQIPPKRQLVRSHPQKVNKRTIHGRDTPNQQQHCQSIVQSDKPSTSPPPDHLISGRPVAPSVAKTKIAGCRSLLPSSRCSCHPVSNPSKTTPADRAQAPA